MTTNQINFASLQETKRANKAREDETNRSNLANERETNRSHLASEDITRSHNVATERETNRSNVAQEGIKRGELLETKRANVARETENTRHNTETERSAATTAAAAKKTADHNATKADSESLWNITRTNHYADDIESQISARDKQAEAAQLRAQASWQDAETRANEFIVNALDTASDQLLKIPKILGGK